MRASDHVYFDAPFIALAHRGGVTPSTLGIENTLPAFAEAVAMGFGYLETDVHATRDHHLVAFHDDHLDRVSDQRGAISDLTFEQVRAVRIGGRAQVPTLDELLGTFPRARFNIDIKAHGAIRLLAETIAAHHAEDRVCVASFSDQRLRAFRDLTRGRVATSCGPSATGLAATVPLVSRFLAGPGLAFQVPISHRVRGIRVPIVTPRFIRAAHASGRQVHVWTINDAAEMNRLIDLGVDGLVSDDIVTLKSVLQERGLWG